MSNRKSIIGLAVLAAGAVSAFATDSQALYQRQMMPMTATPRGGSNSCWGDSGASYVNNCTSTKAISFMTDLGINSNTTPDVKVYGGNNITCQNVWMSPNQSMWGVGSITGMAQTFAYVHMFDLTVSSGNTFSIDCWVPAGSWLGTAQIAW